MTPHPDPALVRGWLAARSLARGLPAPVADHGGWRVDTGTEPERQRYVFAAAGPGLAHLAATITEPAIFLKLCADAATLRAILPPRWTITDTNRMMVTDGPPPPRRPLPAGYIATTTHTAGAAHVAITGPAGDLAASGYAAELDDVFVYDRIVTAEAHRRRGLGHALMTTLATTRRSPARSRSSPPPTWARRSTRASAGANIARTRAPRSFEFTRRREDAKM
ncbi:N-acetyltransferase [Sphingomonas sp. WKB10]|nr:N-acetyltransferase [Sphingomonas sp. WKB10]